MQEVDSSVLARYSCSEESEALTASIAITISQTIVYQKYAEIDVDLVCVSHGSLGADQKCSMEDLSSVSNRTQQLISNFLSISFLFS